MKISKILAGMSAAAIVATTMSMAASAADKPVKTWTATAGGASITGTGWEVDPLTFLTADQAAAVDTVVAHITTDSYINGAIGGNTVAADGWASQGFEYSAAGTYECTLTDMGGLKVDADTGAGYFKVEGWWLNADANDSTSGTATLDSVDFKDADGDIIYTAVGKEGGNTVDTSAYETVETQKLSGHGHAVVDGKIRINVNNPWATDDALKLITTGDYVGADAIVVTVDIAGVTDPFNANIIFSTNTKDGPSYWSADEATGCSTESVAVTADGTYQFLLKLDSPISIPEGGNLDSLFLAVTTDATAASDNEIPFTMSVASVQTCYLPEDGDESTPAGDESTPAGDESTPAGDESTPAAAGDDASSTKTADVDDNKTDNPKTGAAAGLALLGVTLAGAAVVVSKRK